jgi:starch synthase (maltosyl-transferring)
MRLVLAATLSPSYGIYSGFELCENQAVRPGSEEYLASEKYQYKVRDWHRAGNIREAITLVNGIRRNHRALQLAENLVFLASTNPSIIAYLKATADGTDALIVVVNVDPFHAEEGMVRVPPELFEQAQGDEVPVTDLLTGERYRWHWQHNYVRLDPHHWPAHVLRIERALRPRLSPAEEVLREAQRRGATG